MANLEHGKTTLSTAASWEGSVTQEAQAKTYHFDVGGKYVDQDIDLKVTAKSGSVSKKSLGFGESATITEGWIAGTTITNSVAAGSIDKKSIGYGESATVSAGYIAENTTISNSIGAGAITAGSGTVAASIGSTKNSNGKYPITGSAVSTGITVNTAGYVSSTVGTKTTGSVGVSGEVTESTLSSTSVTPGAEQTVTIGAGYYPSQRTVTVKSVSNATRSTIGTSTTDPGKGYTEDTTAIVPAEGWLTLSSGYMPATKISLATLIPDHESHTGAGVANILNGTVAYNKDGQLLVGTMPTGEITNNISGGTSIATINRGSQIKIAKGYYDSDKYYTAQSNSGNKELTSQTGISVDGYATASVKSGSASVDASQTISVSGGTPTKNASTGKYDIALSGSKSITGSATAGWVSSVSSATVSASGTKSLDEATLTDVTSAPAGVTPTQINRGSIKKIAAGYYPEDRYVKGQVNSGNIELTQSSSTSVDGYATATVKAGSASVTAKNFTPTVAVGALDTANNRYAITATGSTTVAGSATAGWISSVSSATVGLTGGTIYMAAAGAPTLGTATLHTNTGSTSGYDYLNIPMTANAGYNPSTLAAANRTTTAQIAVYQGTFTIS